MFLGLTENCIQDDNERKITIAPWPPEATLKLINLVKERYKDLSVSQGKFKEKIFEEIQNELSELVSTKVVFLY